MSRVILTYFQQTKCLDKLVKIETWFMVQVNKATAHWCMHS